MGGGGRGKKRKCMGGFPHEGKTERKGEKTKKII